MLTYMSRVARPPSHRHIHEVKWLHTSLVSSQSPLIRRVIVIGVITYIHLFEEANGKMPEYKLYYFQSKGRAEVIRYIFAQAGQKYEDIRLNGDKWGELKPSETHQYPLRSSNFLYSLLWFYFRDALEMHATPRS